METSGASLIHKGVQYLEEELGKAKNAGGGVFFVDEAYQLACLTGAASRSWTLSCRWQKASLASMGPWCGCLPGMRVTWTSSLFEHNVGLISRFPLHFNFQDFTDEQLLRVFQGLMATQPKAPAGNASGKSRRQPFRCQSDKSLRIAIHQEARSAARGDAPASATHGRSGPSLSRFGAARPIASSTRAPLGSRTCSSSRSRT